MWVLGHIGTPIIKFLPPFSFSWEGKFFWESIFPTHINISNILTSQSELKEANLFVRGQYKARDGETREYVKNSKETKFYPQRDKLRDWKAQRFS